MYRHDPNRSGAGASAIPDAVSKAWSASLGGRLTQPVIADGRVFVASTDTHTLHALAAGDGREIWQFTAGGRIDSSPTVWNQTVIFGSADGWIYCVGAADGELVWRFRAVPAERLVGVHGQLESIWPVHGAVLIQNDTIYATAGRSSYLDGGIVLYRLDPGTGEQLSRTTLYHLNPDTGEQLVPEAKFNMEGTTSDILSGDGELVFLKYFTFDRAGVRTEATRPHLFSITGLLGEDWFVRTYWIVGEGMPGAGWGGWANAANTFPSGQILSFDGDTVVGYGRENLAGGPVGHRADTYRLFRMKRTSAAPPVAKQGKSKPPRPAAPVWTDPQSLIVRAMVLGNDRLAVAGPRDLGDKDPNLLAFTNEPEARAGFEGKKGVVFADCERRRRRENFRMRIARHARLRRFGRGQRPAVPVHARRPGALPGRKEVNQSLTHGRNPRAQTYRIQFSRSFAAGDWGNAFPAKIEFCTSEPGCAPDARPPTPGEPFAIRSVRILSRGRSRGSRRRRLAGSGWYAVRKDEVARWGRSRHEPPRATLAPSSVASLRPSLTT